MTGPIVSVIIPTHNRPQLLSRALESVCSQTRLPEQVVVVDDASEVSYCQVINRLSRLMEGRTELLYHRLKQGGGGSAARNLGAELSRGEILMFLDDDDTWRPAKIERQLKIFRDQPEAGLVYSGRRAVNEHGEVLFTVIPRAAGQIHRLLLQRNYIGITSAVALRREIFMATGGFDRELPARQDYDLWIRATRLTAAAFDPEPTVNWMIHNQPGEQISGDPVKYRQAVEAIFKKYAAEYAALSVRQRRRAVSSQYVILAEKCALAGSSRQYIYALKALFSYPSAAALSRLLPYRLWLWLRSLPRRTGAVKGGGSGSAGGNTGESPDENIRPVSKSGNEGARAYSGSERSLARLLDRFPLLRRSTRQLYMRLNYLFYRERGFQASLAPGVQLATPSRWLKGDWGEEDGDSDRLFFGYYDKSPWSPDGECLLLNRLSGNSSVEIVVFNRGERTMNVLGASTVWNYQQGCMAQWLPGKGGRRIIFNDQVEGNLCCRIISRSDRQEAEGPPGITDRIIFWPVQAVHPSGRLALSINYRRLCRLRPEYGYAADAANFTADLPLNKDGIWKVDLCAGDSKLIITLAELAACRRRPEMERAEHKVNHLLYSPGGTRFVFLHRWLGPQGKFSRLYCAPSDGSSFELLLDYRMISHYCWRDERYLLAWARAPEAGDAYYLIDTVTGEREAVGQGIIDRYGDGHPSFSPGGRFLLTDSYPDRARQRHLLVYDLENNSLKELGRFLAPWNFEGARRCDLHPRWSPDGKAISIDSAHRGRRMSYILYPPETAAGGKANTGAIQGVLYHE